MVFLTSKVGFAAVKITPSETGIPLGGYYVRYSTGVHDDVYARTLYLAADDEVFIIACDLISLYGKFVNRMRKSIKKYTGVKEKNILICALHDHSAPDTMGLEGVKGYFKYTLGAKWFNDIQQKIVKSAVLAKKNAKEGNIGVLSKPLKMNEKVVINRRYPHKELKYPFSVWKITDNDNNLLASVVNFACHGTTLNNKNLLISAEYPGYLINKVENEFSPHFSMYLNGPCGDINPYLFSPKLELDQINLEYYFKEEFGNYNDLCSYDHTKRIGERLADHAIQLLQDANAQPINKIKVFTKQIEIPVLYHHPNMKFKDFLITLFLKKGLIRVVRVLNRSNANYLSFIQKKKQLYSQIELQLIRINEDVLIIAIPAEVFSEIGEELIIKSPIKHTIIVELANDNIGYVFPMSETEKGGYEVFGIADIAGLLPGTVIKNTILQMFKHLKSVS